MYCNAGVVLRDPEAGTAFEDAHSQNSISAGTGALVSGVLVWGAMVAGTLLGCDPHLDIGGKVRQATGTPIAGAKIELRCPNAAQLDGFATSDAAGRFRLPVSIGCADLDCALLVNAHTGKTQTYYVKDHCAKAHFQCRRACSVVDVDAIF